MLFMQCYHIILQLPGLSCIFLAMDQKINQHELVELMISARINARLPARPKFLESNPVIHEHVRIRVVRAPDTDVHVEVALIEHLALGGISNFLQIDPDADVTEM